MKTLFPFFVMIRSVFLLAVIILLLVSLREVAIHSSFRSSSLRLFSSNQNDDECNLSLSQPLSLKDFGVYDKNRNRDGKR